MYAFVSVHKNVRARVKPRMRLRRALKQAQVAGALAGMAGGFFSAVFGSVFTAASWLASSEGVRQWLSTAGTALLILTIPLIIFGGFCMDWVEKGKPQRDPKIAPSENDDVDQ